MTLDQILGELETMPPWKRRALCAAAAERVAPLFRRLGRRASRPTFDATLDALWAAVVSRGVRLDRAALRRLAEAAQDDSHALEYSAGRALEVLYLAATYASGRDRHAAGHTLEAMASLCDGIDVTLTAAPGQTFRYDPRHPPPPGEIETRELRAQADLIALLRDAPAPEPRLMALLRRRARTQGSIYVSAAAQLVAS